MAFELPPLPYAQDALAPHMSEQTLSFHYGKHHQAYVNNLNKLVEGTGDEGKSLEEIILGAGPGGLFNNSAQVWNHTFFWSCMTPGGGGDPEGELKTATRRRRSSARGGRGSPRAREVWRSSRPTTPTCP
jgi:Fe-Mn family superoxide dismutase